MTSKQPHPQRCETCKKLWKPTCPYYAWVDKGNAGISCDSYIEFTSMVGCASHSSAGEQCGDNCNGECSGEVDGISHCPHSAGEPAPGHSCIDASKWTHEEVMNRIQCAYDRGASEARADERAKVLEIISGGKSALYEVEPDGHWNQILQAKMDVLCWLEESLRQQEQQR